MQSAIWPAHSAAFSGIRVGKGPGPVGETRMGPAVPAVRLDRFTAPSAPPYPLIPWLARLFWASLMHGCHEQKWRPETSLAALFLLEGTGLQNYLASSGAMRPVHRQPLPPLGPFSTMHPVLHDTRQSAWEKNLQPAGCNGLATCGHNMSTNVPDWAGCGLLRCSEHLENNEIRQKRNKTASLKNPDLK